MTQEDNTVDGFTANQAGELSEGQFSRLLRDVQIAEEGWKEIPSPYPSIIGATLFVCGPLSLLILWPYRQILFYLLLLVILPGIGLLYLSWQRFYQSVRQSLISRSYQLRIYIGSVQFIRIPGSSNPYDDTYFINADGQMIPVAQSLWEALRPEADGLILHYLTHPFLTLLSAQPIPIDEPPTDSELANVIGIGPDGELIYKEEDTNPARRHSTE